MKILICSDIHGDFDCIGPRQVESADLILCAGDLTQYGLKSPTYKEESEFDRARAWLTMLSEHSLVLWVPGNHDLGFDEHTFDVPGVECILNTYVEINGLGIGGASLSCCYDIPRLAQSWDHMTADPEVEEAALYTRLMELPYLDILVSHSPPYGYQDTTSYSPLIGDERHIGSRSLLKYILQCQPKLVVCGHVHEAAGQSSVTGAVTQVINIARNFMMLDWPNS